MLLSLTIDDVTMIAPPSGTSSAVFTVKLDHPDDGQPVQVDFRTQDATARAGTDYQPVSGTLSFAPGETTKTISVPILGGRTPLPNEMFTVNLDHAVNDTVDPSLGVGTGTIVPTPWLSVGDASVVQGTSGTTSAVFEVTLNPSNTDQPVSVDYGTTDGTARAGTDYQPVSGTLTFAPGETTKSITVPVLGSTAAESQESFSVQLSHPKNAAVSAGQGTGTITNNNQAGVLEFGAATTSVDQTAGTATVTVTRANGNASGVGVAYSTTGGTAVPGVDYTPVSGTLTFDAGQTSRSLTIPILHPAQTGGDRTIGLTLSNPSGGGSLGTRSSTSLTVHGSSTPGGGSTGTTTVPTSPTPTPGNPTPAGSTTPLPSEGANPGTSGATPQGNPDGRGPGGTTTPAPGSSGSTTPAPVVSGPGSLVVTNVHDSGAGSLRQVLLNANAHPGLDTVSFDIPGPGPVTIVPTSPLPAITDPVNIDATTQPGYHGSPLIELDGAGTPGPANGLTITAGGSTVEGLAINRFGGSGILIQGGSGNHIVANAIGTDPSGGVALPNGYDGILVDQSAGNVIGGTSPGAGNLISGNGIAGVQLHGSSSTGNVVAGNQIGTDRTGLKALANQHGGVLIDAPGNTIGGADRTARNVISGNAGSGVVISGPTASNNLVQGNFIGTDAQGLTGLGNRLDGIVLDHASHNLIGGTSAGQGNVISGNQLTGIRLAGTEASENRLEGNKIGTDASGTHSVGNTFDGIFDYGAPGNTIGGTSPGAGNLISGNGGVGIQLESREATENQVLGNRIGTDDQGLHPLGNRHDGVYINNAPGNTIGGTSAGARNVISGNRLVGVQFSGPTATGNVVQGNLIGPDITGTSQPGLGNAIGVVGGGSPGNTIGGSGPARNVIEGNQRPDPSAGGGSRGLSAMSAHARSLAPSIIGVAETRTGTRLSELAVTFSKPVDPARARDIGNYRLRLPGKGQSFDAPDAVPVAIRSTRYDAGTSTVTLTLASPLATSSPLQLRVSGKPGRGITDRAGHSLDGQGSGRRGSDYVTVLEAPPATTQS